MRSSLPFAALLGVALVLGCQDLAPVGPDGLVPQFAREGKGKPDKPGGGDGGSELATVTLGPPMEMASLLASGQNDLKVSLGVFFGDLDS